MKKGHWLLILLLFTAVSASAQTEVLIEVELKRRAGGSPVYQRAVLLKPAAPADTALLFFRGGHGLARIESAEGWRNNLVRFIGPRRQDFFKAGIAKKALVIGTETLSRVLDFYDRDSMIFSDGAGACILEAKSSGETSSGILSSSVQSHCGEEVDYLNLGKSYYPDSDPRIRYIKMKGRKVYEYAMKYVPLAMKACLDQGGVDISQVIKIFIHQANEKMDEGIIKAFYKLYGTRDVPEHIMPMSIHTLGNSSVATVPTLFDMVKKGTMPEHKLTEGDIVLFASVGAGMNINAIVYRI